MNEGVAEYSSITPESPDPYRIFIGEETLKAMDSTFECKPVYVEHVDEVDLANIETTADGWVIRSFFNPPDGKHWAEFIVVSDRGRAAIQNNWKLSNAYLPQSFEDGGLWHGVEYSKEITSGEYEHLAIVPNPRYEESVILTPDEFKAYNEQKTAELNRLMNAKLEEAAIETESQGEGMLNFFKKTKVENSAELENTVVRLPKSGLELSIAKLVANADDVAMAPPAVEKSVPEYADGSEKVKVGDTEMTVDEMISAMSAMKAALADLQKVVDDGKMDRDTVLDKPVAPTLNEEDDKAKAKKKLEEATKKNSYFEELQSAPLMAVKNSPRLEMSDAQLLRGKQRYGSK